MVKPRVYVPQSLRVPPPAPREEAWAVGVEREPGSFRLMLKASGTRGVPQGGVIFGMTHGPYKTEALALDVVGEEGSRVIHFLPDGTDRVTWRWVEWLPHPGRRSSASHWESVE